MKKRIIFLCIIMLYLIHGINAKASILTTYNDSLKTVNNHIVNYKDYQAYLITGINKYLYEDGVLSIKSGFLNSGYLSRTEFNISGGIKSYLYDMNDYFTMSENSSKVYMINNKSNTGISLENRNDVSGVRITNYIKPSSEVHGLGTFADPWVFREDPYPPEIIFSNQSVLNYVRSLNLKVTYLDELSGLAANQTVYYTVQNTNACPLLNSDYNLSKELSNTTEISKEETITIDLSNINDEYYVCVLGGIKDIYGNETDTKIVGPFYIDSKPPVCTISASGMNVVINATDNLSGLQTNAYSFSGASGAFSQTRIKNAVENSTYNAWVIDNAGNVGTCSKVTACASFKSCQSSVCGCAYYNSCQNSSCGCAYYNSCRTSACGCGRYNSCQSYACGCASYNSCQTSSCGCASYSTCRTSGCGCSRYYGRPGGGCMIYNRCSNYQCGCARYASCRTSSCGCAYNKSCQTPSCGCASYNSCRNSACGCASYNSCQSPSCGCASYNSCRASNCGCESLK